MEFLIRLAQTHESFRRAELEALACVQGIDLDFVRYVDHSPFCIVRLVSAHAAKALLQRAILAIEVYELWASGTDYATLHDAMKANEAKYDPQYRYASFRFAIDSFQGKRGVSKQRELINSFSYMDLQGQIKMEGADLQLCILEEFQRNAPSPDRLWLGRWIAGSNRRAVIDYDLKKRRYISRTSMDAELSLVTANLLLATQGKIIYDPFVGTGSFLVAAAHFGAMTLGSDIDPRSIRGTPEKNLLSNFDQYNTMAKFLDSFVSDLTNTPVRTSHIFDGIVCDPPYGVREGPKVLGYREGKIAEEVIIDGVPAHLRPGFIPARRPYGFNDLLQDVLEFSSGMLVEGGRLAMWMPTANDEDVELSIPTHPALELVSVCVQDFYRWSRRLLTYQRKPIGDISSCVVRDNRTRAPGRTADELNPFRKKYFEGFK